MDQSVSVIICAFTEARWNDLIAARNSLYTQSNRPDEVIIVIDHNSRLLDRARLKFPDTVVVPNNEAKGLSGARNTGVGVASSRIVLFLDDDAVAEPQWVQYMTGPFEQSDVVGVGGIAIPAWDGGTRPAWFPPEFLWVVGCSYVGLPADGASLRNPIGSTMGFRRNDVIACGGFSSDLGRIGNKPVGGEETEISMRMRNQFIDSRLVLCRRAIVNHRVTMERHSVAYFMRRCYWEGVSKATIVRLQSDRGTPADTSLQAEKSYVLSVLPMGVVRGVGSAISRRSPRSLGIPAAIVAGLMATCAGYMRSRFVPQRSKAVKEMQPQ